MATRVSSPTFVGRRHELARFEAAMARAREGRPVLFLVAGEAGVGKTRFVKEISNRARASGARVLEGGCIQVGTEGLPFGPVIEALRDLGRELQPADFDQLLGAGRAELSRLMPFLRRPGDDSAEFGTPDSSAQGRLFEHLLLLFERLAQRAPLVILIEDIHWADSSTRELLAFLGRNLRQGPIVLLATYRTDELHRRHALLPFLAEQERSGATERLELARFERPELTTQIESILGSKPDGDLVDRILARSDGNAFFAEELLAGGASSGRLPDTLREILLARVGSLSDETQEVVRVAAAGGTRVSPKLLTTVTEADERHVGAAIREALAHNILVPLEVADEERFAFRHALVQEAVYGELLPGERTSLHARFAHALSDAPELRGDASRAAALAYHWQAALDLPRAFDAWISAGLAAEAIFAFAEARADFEQALALWDLVPDASARAPVDRIELLTRTALLAEGPAPTRSVAYIQAAIALVDPEKNPTRAGLLYERLGQYNWTILDVQAALAAHEEAVRLVPAEPPSAARAWVISGLGHILTVLNRHAEAAAVCEEGLAVARAAGAREVESRALTSLGLNLVVLGEIERGIASLHLARDTARDVGNVHEAANAMTWLIWGLYESGRYDDAVAAGLDAEAYVASHGIGTRWSHCLTLAAAAMIATGRWDEAGEALDRAQRFELVGLNEMMVDHQVTLLEALRGNFGTASRHGSRLRPDPDSNLWADRTPAFAELALWQGDPFAAREAVRPAFEKLEVDQRIWVRYFGWACALGMRAEADIAVQARARHNASDVVQARDIADSILAEIRTLYDEVVAKRPFYVPLAHAWLATCEAEKARLEGLAEPDRWTVAAAAWDALRMPYWRAYALMREGEAALARRGDRARAARALDLAGAIATGLGAAPLLRLVETLAALAEHPARRPARVASGERNAGDRYRLSGREREVLRLVAAGRSDGEIAEALFITKKTASVHVTNIKGKLGAQSRVEIVTSAIGLGLVEAPSTTTSR